MPKLCIAVLALTAVAGAQDVPPPPRPVDAPSAAIPQSADSAAKFLQEKLSRLGRVSWTQTTRNTKTGATTGPAPAFEEITRVLVSAGSCELKVHWNSSQGEADGFEFLEDIPTVAVRSSLEHEHGLKPMIDYTMEPMPFSVELGPTLDFKAPDSATAKAIASAFQILIQQCKTPPTPAAGSGPSVEETISFIEDKINNQGPVNWLTTVSNTVANTSGSPIQMSVAASGARGDPRSCRFQFTWKKTDGGKAEPDTFPFFSFRRVEKLSVLSMEQVNNAQHARAGHPELVETISPPIWILQVNGPANRLWILPFTDQDLANRVAKAMLHAVELCGGGKEPF